MEIAEHLLRPEINAPLSRKPFGELNYRNTLWPEEANQNGKPQPNRYAAIGDNGRNNIQVKDRDHEQQDEVCSPEDSMQTDFRAFRALKFLPKFVRQCGNPVVLFLCSSVLRSRVDLLAHEPCFEGLSITDFIGVPIIGQGQDILIHNDEIGGFPWLQRANF